MPAPRKTHVTGSLRNLPSVDELLQTDVGRVIAQAAGSRHATRQARAAVAALRKRVSASKTERSSKADLLFAAVEQMQATWAAEGLSANQRVINATGVVVHTNLGRAPFSKAAVMALTQAAGYCSLEFDLATGGRGRRGGRAESLIKELSGAEDALIVNNCAAAAFFALSVFAAGGDVVISRGELVEIGGDFRVPEVLSASGATLCEVGTTNRTKLTDYEWALTRRAKMILRVHPSNYRIVGFTASPQLAELADLAHRRGVLLYEDLGSGALIDLGVGEPTVADSIKAGVDVVTFSGDKLLGGVQAGIIAGRKEIVAKLRRHPLYRALRPDKLTYAALEATLLSYRRGTAKADVPVARMLTATRAQIRRRAKAMIAKIMTSEISHLRFEIANGISATGGGAAPGIELETALIAVTHGKRSAVRLEQTLRRYDPPVIARIVDDQVVIDLRTVNADEEDFIVAAIRTLD
ncbi:MAG: L-seryl-tRNA(Sec) selenium transferase [Chloracidobacterium sp.]|nr:L-seryl-tRNA(Sec) selenium transferase [Chloracidobacterium sp.]